MKRKTAFLLAAVLTLSALALSPMANEFGAASVIVDGTALETEALIANGIALASIRAVDEALGALVSWEAETKTAVITKAGKTAYITAGYDYLHTDDIGSYGRLLDTPPIIIDGAMYSPIDALCECFGAKSRFYPDEYTLVILTEENTAEADAALVLKANYAAAVVERAVEYVSEYYDVMTDEETKKYFIQYSNEAKAATDIINSGIYTDEELKGCIIDLDMAASGLAWIAEEYGADESFVTVLRTDFNKDIMADEETAAEAEKLFKLYLGVTNCFNGRSDEMSKEQLKTLDEYNEAVIRMASIFTCSTPSKIEISLFLDATGGLEPQIEAFAEELGVTTEIDALYNALDIPEGFVFDLTY